MKIYMVSHYYDNGESYEDYREYENHYYYSTFELASASFREKATSDYEGEYTLSSVELDTQKTECLEKTPYLPCSSQWDKYCAQDNTEPEDDYPENDYPDPMKSYKDYWRHEDAFWHEDGSISEEEDKAWLEYITTPGTNYKEWKEINEEIQKRKNGILLEELNSILVELLK